MSNVGNGGAQHRSQDIEVFVLARDDYTCQMCGADADDFPDGRLSACVFPPRAGLTSPNAADLKTLCPDCSNGSATAKFLPRMDARRLLVELRRATGADQLVIRDWLLRKYPRGD